MKTAGRQSPQAAPEWGGVHIPPGPAEGLRKTIPKGWPSPLQPAQRGGQHPEKLYQANRSPSVL